MSVYDKEFDRIIGKALNVLHGKGADIYTFALYYDHESYSVSALADTKINSKKVARAINEFSYKNFINAIQSRDLKKASRWGSATHRSYALGDFKFKSLGWEQLKAPNNSAPFYLAMVNAINRNAKNIAALSRSPETLVFCSSTKDSEVGLTWYYSED